MLFYSSSGDKHECHMLPCLKTNSNKRHIDASTRLPGSHTWATPHFSQMAIALPRLFTQIHHISAYCFRGDRHFCEVLFIVAEVHGEKHLETKRKKHNSYQYCPHWWWSPFVHLSILSPNSLSMAGPWPKQEEVIWMPCGPRPRPAEPWGRPGAVRTEGQVNPSLTFYLCDLFTKYLPVLGMCQVHPTGRSINPVRVIRGQHTHSCSGTASSWKAAELMCCFWRWDGT